MEEGNFQTIKESSVASLVPSLPSSMHKECTVLDFFLGRMASFLVTEPLGEGKRVLFRERILTIL